MIDIAGEEKPSEKKSKKPKKAADISLQFYIIDASYKVNENADAPGGKKAEVYLYGRTLDGQQVCVVDPYFEPYFYAIPTTGASISAVANEIEKIKQKSHETNEEFAVTRAEPCKRKLREVDVEAIKISTNLPSAVPVLREAVRAVDGVKDVLEYDILFVRRYLIDKALTPLTLIEADVEQRQGAGERSRVPLFTIISPTSIRQASDQTLTDFNILAVDIETYNPLGKNVIPEEHPILMLALTSNTLSKVITWKHFSIDKNSPLHSRVEFVKSELELIERFAQIVEEQRPDLLAGYYSDGFDLPYLKTRAAKYRIKLDISLDHSELKVSGKATKTTKLVGICHFDVFKVVRKLIGRSMETDSFTLDAVAEELLGEKKHQVDLGGLAKVWDGHQEHPEKLASYCAYNLQDAHLTYKLALKVLPNAIEMVKIVGQPLYDVIRMSFSQLVEWLIMRNASPRGELAPNRPRYAEQQTRSATKYKGAFVFQPTPGLYRDIVVFDFRSLYPTIIAAHNISPGTLNCSCCEGTSREVPFENEEKEKGRGELNSVRQRTWFCAKKKGLVASIIEDLIMRRQRIKEILRAQKGVRGVGDATGGSGGDGVGVGAVKDPLLAARSETVKVLANSFYGYLGFAPARWYSRECAESVTAWGRHYIQDVIAKAQKDGFHILYSDTDSIFFALDKKSTADALRFVEKVNQSLPKLMELEYENQYPAGIFVSMKGTAGTKGSGRGSEMGAKKKYALMDNHGVMKVRGFETVRRNWSFIAKDLQRNVLGMVLKDRNPERALTHVRQIVKELRDHTVPVEQLAIFTQLQKGIGEYESVGPHVAAAQRMKDQGKDVFPGDVIKYVIVKGINAGGKARGKGGASGKSGEKIRDRVRLLDEVKQEEYDADYYIDNQILPSVDKIFEVLGYKKEDIIGESSQSTLETFG